MNSLSLKAYAKINLSLDITGIRDDGYHLLKTVMQSVDIYDTVTVRLNDSGIVKLSCTNTSVPVDNKNTAFKAAEKFFEYCNLKNGADINIEKYIPSEAGMGGASADAAAVITVLNKLTNSKLSDEELLKIGLLVGADVPFCLTGGTALCEGIGEKITPLCKLPECFIVIAKPEIGISTAKAYSEYDKSKKAAIIYTDNLLLALENKNINQIAKSTGNIFELLIQCPEVEDIKHQMMNSGALSSCMTGSGSAVFGIFSDEETAITCKNNLKDKYPFVSVTKAI